MSGTVYRNSVKVKGELAAPSVPSYMKMASHVAGYSEATAGNRIVCSTLAPNGKLYFMPGLNSGSQKIVVLDPLTGDIENLGCGSWMGYGAVTAPDGMIYGMPGDSTSSIMKLNPETHEVDVDHLTGVGGSMAYHGARLHPNGNIYFIPSDATNVGVYDYVNNVFSSTTAGLTGLPATSNKWMGACIAPNGKMYCGGYGHNSILIIDPETPSVDYTTIAGMSTYVNTGWRKGTLAPNGKIYFAPRDSTSVLIVDPETDTADETTIAGLPSTDKYSQGTLAPNGKIYCFPIYANNALVIDPVTNTVDTTTYTGFRSGYYKYYNSILAPNGKVYSAGYGDSFYKFVELNPGGIPILPIEPLLSLYVNNG